MIDGVSKYTHHFIKTHSPCKLNQQCVTKKNSDSTVAASKNHYHATLALFLFFSDTGLDYDCLFTAAPRTYQHVFDRS